MGNERTGKNSHYSHSIGQKVRQREHIAAFCDELGLDFGALDMIRDNVDGRVYLLDANKTPGTEVLQAEVKTGDRGLSLFERAPFGVIGSITPSTNPTSTSLQMVGNSSKKMSDA